MRLSYRNPRRDFARGKEADKLNFEDAFAQMAKDQEAMVEVEDMEGTIGDGLEKDEY